MTTLERLLRSLDRIELQRVASAYGLSPRRASEALLLGLGARPELDALEIVSDVLRSDGLRRIAKAFDLPASGTREQLAKRLIQALRYLPFEEARAHVRSLGLRSVVAWKHWWREHRPTELPGTPDRVYRGRGWTSWPDFLGSAHLGSHNRVFRPFEAARTFVHALGLESRVDWLAWCAGDRPDLPPRPADIPTNPHRTYKAQWKGMADWVGSTKFLHQFRSFVATRRLARSLHFRNQEEWYAWAKTSRPRDVPYNPDRTYKAEWKGWGDFLGTGIAPTLREWRAFRSAHTFARSLGLRSQEEWVAWCVGDLRRVRGRVLPERPADIPTNPHMIYRGRGWVSSGDWLGTGQVSNQIRSRQRWPFPRAHRYARGLGLRSQEEWKAWCLGRLPGKPSRPLELPTNPWRSYKSEWQGWPHWLGTTRE